jgi:methionine-rich copper-binding protein CopC
LRNIEVLRFADSGNATVPAAPTNVTAVAGNQQATVNFTPGANGGSPVLEFEIDVIQGGAVLRTVPDIAANATSAVVTGLTNGTAYTFRVRAINAVGESVDSAASNSVTPQPPNAAPTVTARTPGVGATGVPVGDNITATFSEAVQGVTNTTFVVRSNAAPNTVITATVTRNGTTNQWILNPAANLQPNTAYTVTLTGGAAAIRDLQNAPLATTTWSFTTAAANAAPTVTARTPAVNATGVLVGNNIDATFSEPVQGVSNTTFFIRSNAAPGTAIAATVTQDGTTNRWILNPTANLAANTTHTVTLTGGAAAIRDLAGAPLATTTWSFTTGAAPNVAPTVTTRTPAVDATVVAVANNITATFSEAVVGVSTATFQLRNPAGTVLAGVVTQNGNQWILNPNANLAADTRYTVTLTGGTTAIRDTAGAPLVTTSWSFLTGPAPTVTARTPAVNATGVGRLANVTATFSEAVQAVSGTTVQLTRVSTGAVVTAVVTYNATTRVVTLNPSVTLAANAQFRVNLTGGATGIRDAAGNPLANVTWTFTTGG